MSSWYQQQIYLWTRWKLIHYTSYRFKQISHLIQYKSRLYIHSPGTKLSVNFFFFQSMKCGFKGLDFTFFRECYFGQRRSKWNQNPFEARDVLKNIIRLLLMEFKLSYTHEFNILLKHYNKDILVYNNQHNFCGRQVLHMQFWIFQEHWQIRKSSYTFLIMDMISVIQKRKHENTKWPCSFRWI